VTDRRRILVELTDQARQGAAEVYGPFVQFLSEWDKYSDTELEFITRYTERGSELLLEHMARIERLPRRRRSADSSGDSG
jgi:DNA-binding MarR family transcriptional regulator